MAGRSLALALNMLILNYIFQGSAEPPGAIKPEPRATVIGKPRALQGTAEGPEPARIEGLGPRFPALSAPGTDRPGDKNPCQNGRQPKPGQCILQVVVRQAHDEPAGLRQAAGRHRRFLLAIERRGG